MCQHEKQLNELIGGLLSSEFEHVEEVGAHKLRELLEQTTNLHQESQSLLHPRGRRWDPN